MLCLPGSAVLSKYDPRSSLNKEKVIVKYEPNKAVPLIGMEDNNDEETLVIQSQSSQRRIP